MAAIIQQKLPADAAFIESLNNTQNSERPDEVSEQDSHHTDFMDKDKRELWLRLYRLSSLLLTLYAQDTETSRVL